MLILFDIDYTLLHTGDAGLHALQSAASEFFQSACPELDLAGSTDLGVADGLFKHFGIDSTPAKTEAFFTLYLEKLEQSLWDDQFQGTLLPGMKELITATQERGHHLALLTGNLKQGAYLKTQRYGVADAFPVGSYGDDCADRNKLGPIVLERASNYYKQEFTGQNTVVLGDTPKDIRCGKAIQAKTICFATGSFSVAQLEEAGADFVHQNASNLDLILEQICAT